MKLCIVNCEEMHHPAASATSSVISFARRIEWSASFVRPAALCAAAAFFSLAIACALAAALS